MATETKPASKDFPFTTEDWTSVFRAQPGDVDSQLTVVEGKVPHELNGVYYLNGPGLMFMEGVFGNPFDGHGYIRAFSIEGGSNSGSLKTRFVKTEAYERESKANQFVYKGFGTVLPGGMLRNMTAPANKNVANTCVVEHGGKLLCLWEGGLPHVLDPTTLETQPSKVFDFGGAVPPKTSLIAHTRYDATNKRLVCLGQEGMVRPQWTFYEVDENNTVVHTVKHAPPQYMYVHDFTITDKFYILVESPMSISFTGLAQNISGLAPTTRMLQFDKSRNSRLILVPRQGGGEAVYLETDTPLFSFHHLNAWDTKDGAVCFASCCFKNFSFGGEFGYAPTSTSLDPSLFSRTQSGQRVSLFRLDPVKKTCVRTETDIAGDFPRAHPDSDGRPNKFTYMAQCHDASIGLPFDQVAKLESKFDPESLELDVQGVNVIDTWRIGQGRQFLGEPVFVPRPGEGLKEDDGWVLVVNYDAAANRSELLILDASKLSKGPVCRLAAPVMLPMGFHGSFVPRQADTEANGGAAVN